MSSLVEAHSDVATLLWRCCDIETIHFFQMQAMSWPCRGDVATLDGCYSLTVSAAFDVVTLSYTVATLK